jgi:hypothetical protein
MNKTTMLGVGVVGIGLAAAYMKMKGGGPSDLAARLTAWDEGPSAWLDLKHLYSYTESSGAKGDVYAFTFSGPGDSSHENPQAIICVTEGNLEAAKLAGTQTIRIFYDGVEKIRLTTPSVVASL